MDLGIAGRRAIVCASSKGLGKGVAQKLAEAGAIVTLNGRNPEALALTASEIRKQTNAEVHMVVADVTTAEGRAALLDAEPSPDILVNNAGGPPPGLWSDWTEDDWLKALHANMLAPILLMKAVLPGMIDRKWGRVINITSASVKAPIPELGLSNASRSGLTGFVAGTARQVAKHGVIINNLLPGSHETDRTEGLMKRTAAEQSISLDEARRKAHALNPIGRFGTPEEFGAAAAFLCSQYAGYIVGQNLLLDGGAFQSTHG
ncbi:3-oxoacyl-[acyl-carrier protein] reductase [Rhizobium sp. BIGb0125]|jgi:3-oxoacyl-[acyl-carrier protein] reductase|uniref:SDR family oxidoreductase n=1 Tax=Rhizobium sp. BIGb0125 TaxID=2940618 RepID=UPI002169792F|nr:SDR family oxidoreductase [Rhizobium sp. BIGb0125]MCS4243991.1 3-oxoacyl-[acyl-carrier protein] reductase [Rhizobium sp. BIGb0125]